MEFDRVGQIYGKIQGRETAQVRLLFGANMLPGELVRISI